MGGRLIELRKYFHKRLVVFLDPILVVYVAKDTLLVDDERGPLRINTAPHTFDAIIGVHTIGLDEIRIPIGKQDQSGQ